MPLPSPAQIVYGSATVICTAFPLLLLAPEASPVTATLVAVGSLTAGLVVAVLAGRRRTARFAAATPVVPAGTDTPGTPSAASAPPLAPPTPTAAPATAAPAAALPQPADHGAPSGIRPPAHAATHAARRSGVSV